MAHRWTARRLRRRKAEITDQKTEKDPFDEIDFGTFFDDYLDPGYKSPASETVEKPSFETFLSSPVTLGDHLHSQLAVLVLSEDVRDAADNIIGNLDENGYLTATLEEIAESGQHTTGRRAGRPAVVQSLDPAGVGAKDVRECLLLQLESRNGKGGVAWQIVVESSEAGGDPADQGNRQAAGPAAGARPDRDRRDPASGPVSRACAIRARARGRWSRTSTSSRTATNISSS